MTGQEDNLEATVKNPASKDTAAGSSDVLEYSKDDLILDRYRVIKVLGRGGMGSVYEVEHVILQARYAMKFLNKNQTNDAAWRRFEIEARATDKLDHPNLIKVHDFGLLPDGQPYFIMDLVEGETLADILKRRGRLKEDQCLKIFIQVGFALSYAHSNGVIHRDIKPSNIILSNSDTGDTDNSLVKLVDFGIAKLTGQDGFNQQTLTRTGEIFGSPLYMSPEQCLGIAVDHRSDLYSLGCVMFESLTGAPPLVGDSALGTMMKHQTENPLSLREASLGMEFSKRIEQVVERLLAKDVKDRYQSAELLTADLVGLDTAQIFTGALSPLPAPQKIKDDVLLSKPVLALLAFFFLVSGYFIGFTIKPAILLKFPDVKSIPEKQVTLINESFLPKPGESNRSAAERKVASDYLGETRKTTYFSEPQPDGSRVFHFPNFAIGEYSARGARQTASPWTVRHFKGIYFHPNQEFRKHPQMFLRFRPDDINVLNISNTRTFANLLSDSLTDVDEVLPYLTHLKSIGALAAADSEITSRGMPYFDQLSGLKVLKLERSKLDGNDLAKLNCLTRLVLLNIHTVRNCDKVVKALAASKTIQTLSLVDCNVKVNEFKQLLKIPSLTELNVSKNAEIGDEQMKLLPPRMQKLSFAGCPVTAKSTKQLAKLTRLQLLILDESLWTHDQMQVLHDALPHAVIQFVKVNGRSTQDFDI